jgi:hypothetical protein
MQRRQHFAAVNYSEEERTEPGGILPTQRMREEKDGCKEKNDTQEAMGLK